VFGARRSALTPVITNEPMVGMQLTLLDHESYVLGRTLHDEFKGAAVSW